MRTEQKFFFALVALGMIATFVWGRCTSSVRHVNAEEAAHDWVQHMFPPEEAREARISCQSTDSDGNGYLSCTINVQQNGEANLIPIECTSYVVDNYGDTCRTLTPFATGRRR